MVKKKFLSYGIVSIMLVSPIILPIKKNNKKNNKKTKSQIRGNELNYEFAKESMFELKSKDKICNGYYNTVIQDKNPFIFNENLVFCNKNKVWIFYYNNRWLISKIDPQNFSPGKELISSSKTKSKVPSDCFLEHKIIINDNQLIHLLNEIPNEYDNEYLEVYSNDNIISKNILASKILLKSNDLINSNYSHQIKINNANNKEINGIYKTHNLKNRYGYIYKKDEYWLFKVIMMDKEYLKFNVIWCLSKSMPTNGIYLEEPILFVSRFSDKSNLLKVPSYSMLNPSNANEEIFIKSDSNPIN